MAPQVGDAHDVAQRLGRLLHLARQEQAGWGHSLPLVLPAVVGVHRVEAVAKHRGRGYRQLRYLQPLAALLNQVASRPPEQGLLLGVQPQPPAGAVLQLSLGVVAAHVGTQGNPPGRPAPGGGHHPPGAKHAEPTQVHCLLLRLVRGWKEGVGAGRACVVHAGARDTGREALVKFSPSECDAGSVSDTLSGKHGRSVAWPPMVRVAGSHRAARAEMSGRQPESSRGHPLSTTCAR